MLTNGGEYNPETAYEQLTMVMYENSTYITLKTVQGITPTDDHINYQLMAKGFNPTALESVQAEDTSGVLGEVGGTVSAQDLINWVVDQAATKLLKISDLVSVQTNDATKGVSAALAYAMGQKLDQLNSNFSTLVSYGNHKNNITDLNNFYNGYAVGLFQNSPSASDYWWVISFSETNEDTCLQFAVLFEDYGSTKFYSRRKAHGTWHNWRSVDLV
jgi:hypothetical protein